MRRVLWQRFWKGRGSWVFLPEYSLPTGNSEERLCQYKMDRRGFASRIVRAVPQCTWHSGGQRRKRSSNERLFSLANGYAGPLLPVGPANGRSSRKYVANPDVTGEVVVVEVLARENVVLPEQLRFPSRQYSRTLYSVVYLDL